MEEKKEALVSIIMPAYNCEKFIDKAIISVVNQTYKNWELIVVDDCSTDNTEKIIQQYTSKDNRIKYYKLNKNSGTAVARNKAIDLAIGQYIAFLDSDDLWFLEKLVKQIGYMEENDYFFTCTSYTKIDEHGKNLNRIIEPEAVYDYNGVLKTCPGNSTVIYNAEQIGKVKIPNIRKRNDYVMWLSVIKKTIVLYGMKEPLSSHRIRSGSLSKNKMNLVGYHWKVYRKIEKLSLFKSSYLIIYWVVDTLFKLR